MEQRTWADACLIAYGALLIVFGMLIAWSVAEDWPAPAAEFARMSFVAVLALIALRIGQIGQTRTFVREERETRRALEESIAGICLQAQVEAVVAQPAPVPAQGLRPLHPVIGADR